MPVFYLDDKLSLLRARGQRRGGPVLVRGQEAEAGCAGRAVHGAQEAVTGVRGLRPERVGDRESLLLKKETSKNKFFQSLCQAQMILKVKSPNSPGWSPPGAATWSQPLTGAAAASAWPLSASARARALGLSRPPRHSHPDSDKEDNMRSGVVMSCFILTKLAILQS